MAGHGGWGRRRYPPLAASGPPCAAWGEPGSFSFRIGGCTTGPERVKGFCPTGVLLARHAPHESKPFTKVGHHDSTASSAHRGLSRNSRRALSSRQTSSLIGYARYGLLCDVVWLPKL